jgi:hypothetical protein
MKLNFDKKLVAELLAHSIASANHRKLYGRPETEAPGLMLVGDQGVYLMSNGDPGLLNDNPNGTKFKVAYAVECDPNKLEFNEWWANKRASFGGDDGCEFISAESAADLVAIEMQSDSMKIICEPDVTPLASVHTDSLEVIRKIGANRGKPRIWLEGKILSEKGWNRGTEFFPSFSEGRIRYIKDSGYVGPGETLGKIRKVAGSETRPVIDTNSVKIQECFGDIARVEVSITEGEITILPHSETENG